MADPRGFIGAFIAVIVSVTMIGASLNIDTTAIVEALTKLMVALLPGIFIGAIVAAWVTKITDHLPAGLLFGGATATVLTIIFRIWFWANT